jgi:hypothetical protein
MSPNGPRSTVVHVHRRRGRSLNSLAIQLSAFALTFILIALLVVTSSRAAFVAQNDNSTNQVSSAAIALTDNDSSTAMFDSLGNMVPGQTYERCIDVTYTGSIDPTAVMLYGTGTPGGTLAPYLNLTVQIGADTPAAFRDCTGFSSTGTVYTGGTLQDFATTKTNFTNGVSTWDPAGPIAPATTTTETRTFRFAFTVTDVAAAANKTTTFGFSWETRTNP